MLSHISFPCSLGWSWRSAAVMITGGASLNVWFEEIIEIAIKFIGLIFIFIMTGVIYLFTVYVFKSTAPKADNSPEK